MTLRSRTCDPLPLGVTLFSKPVPRKVGLLSTQSSQRVHKRPVEERPTRHGEI